MSASAGFSADAAPPPTRPSSPILHARLAPILIRSASILAIIAILAVFAVASPYFLTVGNIAAVLGQSAILGVLAIGMTVVMIGGGANVVTGGIDLSLAANVGLSAAVYATLAASGQSDALAALGALATGLAIGAVNAIAVMLLRIVPLLATLAVMNVVAGLELVLTQNTAVPVSTPFLDSLAGNGPFLIPVLAFVLVAIAAAALLAQATPLGLRLHAVGAFPEAARAAGLSVRSFIVGSYLVSGLTGGFAGILSVAYLSGSTTGSGDMLLSIVVTALLGVVFSPRLVPTIGGSIVSTLFIGLLINGYQLLNISSYWVNGVQGVLIIVVVAATSLLRRSEVVS